jgi:hypothetical protein
MHTIAMAFFNLFARMDTSGKDSLIREVLNSILEELWYIVLKQIRVS